MRYLFFALILIAQLVNPKMSFGQVTNPGFLRPANGDTLSDHYALITANSGVNLVAYRFQVDSVNTFNSPALSDTTFSNRFGYGLNEFSFGTTIYIRSKVYSTSDSSDWSTPIKAIIGRQLNLQSPANGTTGDFKDLRWFGMGGSEGYELWADTTKDFNSSNKVIYKDLSQSPIRLTMLDSIYLDKKYYWKVRTFFKADTSKWSRVWSFNYQPTAKVTYPRTGVIYQLGSTELRLGWDKTTMMNLEVQLSKSSDFSTIERSKVFDASASTLGQFDKIDFAQTYYARWRWRNKLQVGSWEGTGVYRTRDIRLVAPRDNAFLKLRKEKVQFFYNSGLDTSHLQVATDSNFKNLLIDSFFLTTFWEMPSLNYNTTYYARVRMMHFKDTSHWSSIYTWQTVDVTRFNNLMYPSRGTEVDPSFRFSTTSQLTGADSISIMIDTVKDFNSKYKSYFGSAYPNGQIMPEYLDFGKVHYYRYRVLHKDSVSAWSNLDSFKTWSTLNIGASYPPNGARNWGTQNNMIIRLNEFKRGYEYFVWELDTTSLFNSSALQRGRDTTGKDMENNSKHYLGTEYYWRVAPAHRNDTAAFGPIWNFQSHISLLFEPKNKSENLEKSVKFKWSTSFPGLTGFQFQLDTSSSFSTSSPENINGGDNNELTKNGLLPDATYYWRVRPRHEFDTGKWSEVYSFTTKPAPQLNQPQLRAPANNATNIEEGVVTFRWQASGVTGTNARLQISSNSNFSTTLYNADVTGTSISLNGFTKDQTYYWRLRFKLDGDQGPWSQVYSFETEKTTNSIESFTNEKFKIYPNPASNKIVIETFESGSYFIFDLMGKETASGVLASVVNEIDISYLPSGIYSVKLLSGREIYDYSFVKE
ncbi:MAG: T9SS type A sorting domain-containing protein [Bacteroidia bacterium]